MAQVGWGMHNYNPIDSHQATCEQKKRFDVNGALYRSLSRLQVRKRNSETGQPWGLLCKYGFDIRHHRKLTQLGSMWTPRWRRRRQNPGLRWIIIDICNVVLISTMISWVIGFWEKPTSRMKRLGYILAYLYVGVSKLNSKDPWTKDDRGSSRFIR